MSHLPKKVIYVDEESLFSNLIGKTEYNIEYNKNGRIEKISALHGYSKFALTYEGNLLKKVTNTQYNYLEEEINTTTSYNYNLNGTLKEVTTEGESYKETLEYKWEGYKMNVDRKVYNYKDGNMIREYFSSSLYHIYTYGDKINKFLENYFLYGGRDEPAFCAFNFPVSIFSSKNLPTSAEFYNKYYDRYVLSEKRTYKYEFDNMGRVTKIIEFYQKFNQDGSPDGERKKQPSIIFVY